MQVCLGSKLPYVKRETPGIILLYLTANSYSRFYSL